jgi:hypothetical protein
VISRTSVCFYYKTKNRLSDGCILVHSVKKFIPVKVKSSRYRPGLAQRAPGGLGSQIFHDIRHMKVVRSSSSHTGRLYTQECSWYSFSLGAGSTPGPWCGRKEMSLKNPVTPPGIDPGTVRLVAQRLNHYATSDPNLYQYFPYFFSDLGGIRHKKSPYNSAEQLGLSRKTFRWNLIGFGIV